MCNVRYLSLKGTKHAQQDVVSKGGVRLTARLNAVLDGTHSINERYFHP